MHMRCLLCLCLIVPVLGGCWPEPATELTITLINDTDLELDPMLFVSDRQVGEDELFDGFTYAYRAFGDKGLLDPRQQVQFTLPCDQAATIGSHQAGFSDLDTFTGGTSVDSPLLHLDADFACGQTVTFRFSRHASGLYHTTADVSN